MHWIWPPIGFWRHIDSRPHQRQTSSNRLTGPWPSVQPTVCAISIHGDYSMWRLHRKKATQVWFHVMCPAFLRKKMCFVTNTSWADTWMIIPLFCFIQGYSSSTCTWHLPFWNRFRFSPETLPKRYRPEALMRSPPISGTARWTGRCRWCQWPCRCLFWCIPSVGILEESKSFCWEAKKRNDVWFLYTLLGKTCRFCRFSSNFFGNIQLIQLIVLVG